MTKAITIDPTPEQAPAPAPIAIEAPALVARMQAMLDERGKIDLILTHTIRTAADVLGIPEGYQFDPETLAFMPPVQDPGQEAA